MRCVSLRACFAGKVEDAADGAGRGRGVNRAEHQVPGLRRLDRRLERPRSRISPTSMTSGSSRTACFIPIVKFFTSMPISRW